MTIVKLEKAIGINSYFNDGDWVESKDQDPNGEVRLIQLADIGVGEFLDKSSRFLTKQKAEELKCSFLEEGDILIARMPDPIARACIFPKLPYPCVTVVDVCIIRVDPDAVDNRWLMWIFNSPSFKSLLSPYLSGTTRQRISRSNLAKSMIPLPPIAQQKRIAAILDKADAVRRKRREAIRLTEELLRSTFLEMFGDPVTNPNGWNVIELGQEVSEFRYGTSEKCEAYSILMNHPVLRIPNILDGEVSLDDLKYTSVSKDEFDRIVLNSGDLLFVRSNGNPEYIGRCAVFNFEDGETLYASYLIRARLKKSSIFLPEFVRDQILYPTYRHKVMKEAKTTAGNYNINIQGLSRLKLIAPPIDLQRKYVLLYRKIRNYSIRLADDQRESENLFNSLLQRAFTGNL